MLNTPLPLFFFTLAVHVAAGFAALLTGLMPLFLAKGGGEHRAWGRVFLWAMGLVSLTSFPLAYWRSDLFQAEVGVFTGYLTWYGLRSLKAGRGRDTGGRWDWAAAGAAGAAFIAFCWQGTVIALVFGLLGLLMAGRDLHALWAQDFSKRRRVVDHLLALCLALLAGYSAFLNTQFNRMTGLDWSLTEKMGLPLMLGLPGLLIWAWVWERKLRVLPKRVTPRPTAGPAKKRGRSTILKNNELEAPQIKRLRGLAIAEGVSFLLLLGVAVPLKHLLGLPQMVRVLGPIHGGLFILYVVAVFQAAPLLHWSARQTALALGAGVVPAGTFFVEARLKEARLKTPRESH